jgi:hypothetical protein
MDTLIIMVLLVSELGCLSIFLYHLQFLSSMFYNFYCRKLSHQHYMDSKPDKNTTKKENYNQIP